MLTFAHLGLLALLPLPLALRYVVPPFQDSRAAIRVPMFDVLVESLGERPSSGSVVRRRAIVQTMLFAMCWFCIVVALAKPQWLEPPVEQDVPTRDLLLAIDLSGSMETEDFVDAAGKKVDRLTAAKEVLDEFLQRRSGDRVGMIVFGTGAFIQVPFTQDLEVCRKLLDETQPRMAGPKTAFGDAIGLGVTLFQRSELEDKVMIVMTDGNDTASKVPPEEAARIAADNGVIIHTIGVGDPVAVGEDPLDEEALKSVAQTTGGRYFHADDRAQLESVYDELDRMGTREVETISHRAKLDLYHWPLGVAVLFSLVFHALYAFKRIVRTHHLRALANQVEEVAA